MHARESISKSQVPSDNRSLHFLGNHTPKLHIDDLGLMVTCGKCRETHVAVWVPPLGDESGGLKIYWRPAGHRACVTVLVPRR